MEESTVYQFIIERGEARGEAHGEVRGARNTLLAFATRRLGRPKKKALAALEAITNVDRIGRMAAVASDVRTWDELLATE